MGPRSAPENVEPRHAGSRGGYYLLTPMELENGDVIMVNRGWIRADLKDSIQQEQETSKQLVTLAGVLRGGEIPSSFIPMKSEGRNWLYVDPDKMMEQVGKPPLQKETLLLDVLSPRNPQGRWPARKTTESYTSYHTTPELHSVYAATWFSLAAAIVGLTFIRFRRPHPTAALKKHRPAASEKRKK